MKYPTNSAQALELGRMDARRDLSNGVVIVKTAGLPTAHTCNYERLLQERCNVKSEALAGCVVSEGLLAYVRGYNEISGSAIRQKFGTNIFRRLDLEAGPRWRKSPGAENPPTTNGIYLVKSGDTLAKIAHAHRVKLNDLLQANRGINPTSLQIKQPIIIP